MRYLLIYIWLFSFNSFAQKSQALLSDVFRIDSFPATGILLDKGWKWHAGDNPDWAKPEIDDSKWEAIDPIKSIQYLPEVRRAEVGWFRLHLRLNPSIVSQPLAIQVQQVGASDLFLNGRQIRRFGNVSADPTREATFNPKNEPFTVTLDSTPNQVLAVRYSFTRQNRYLNNTNNTFSGNPGLIIRLRPVDAAWRSVSDYRSGTILTVLGFDYLLLGLFGLLGCLHLFFYLSYPTRRANLFFSLYAFFAAGSAYLDVRQFVIRSTNDEYINDALFLIVNLLLLYNLLRAVYEFLAQPKGLLFHVLTFYLLLSGGYVYFFYEWGWSLAFYANYLLVYAETTRISHLAKRRLEPDAGFLFWAQMLGTISIFAFTLSFVPDDSVFVKILLNLMQPVLGFIQVVGLFSLILLPITISFLLAREFARTSLALEKKLIEVESLSAQTIAQEQEKQQILATQNETLERKVAERTAELKATQNQLIQKEKLASLGELTAGIAHEIQNPLNFVNNFSEVSAELVEEMQQELTKGDTDEAKAIADDIKQNLEKINHHGKRASSIVKGMLEHSRQSTGERELTDINQLADEYLRLAYHGLRAKDSNFNCELLTDFEPNLPQIEVIPQDIGRVLLNLINNAFYAVNERFKSEEAGYQPKVTVSTQFIDSQLKIAVQDNGVGMSKEVQAKVFQPFFTTKPTGQGTGLGLSLAYDIVTKGHGGTLEVESTEGVGSAFIFQLPIA